MENNKNRPPKFYFTLRIIGFAMLIVGITGAVLGIVIRQPFGSHTMPTLAIMVPGIFIAMFSVMPIFISFSPEIEKLQIEKRRYIQE